MTSPKERTRRTLGTAADLSTVAAALFTLGTAVLAKGSTLPSGFAQVSVAILGLITALLLWHYLPMSKPNFAKAIMITLIAIFTLGIVFVIPADRGSKDTSREASSIADRLREDQQLADTFRDGLYPTRDQHIGTCVEVRGQGRIPDGYQVWAANLNDKDGSPDTNGVYGFHIATPIDGQDAWRTEKFSVGEPSANGKKYWIYVYLVPNSVGSVLQNVILNKDGDAASLRRNIENVAIIDRVPVERTADRTC